MPNTDTHAGASSVRPTVLIVDDHSDTGEMLAEYLDFHGAHAVRAENVEEAMKALELSGDFGLLDKIDTSHTFLYGHRYWPQVKQAGGSELNRLFAPIAKPSPLNQPGVQRSWMSV